MALPRVIKNFNAFVDGVSYFGLCLTGTLPVPKIMTEANRNSGMDGPVGIDMGTEAMTASLTFAEHRPDLLCQLGRLGRFVMRPAQGSATDTGATAIIATIGGLITTAETGELKPGTNSTLKLDMDVRYYRLEIDGAEVFELDLVNAIRRVGGVDQLAEIRRAMGL